MACPKGWEALDRARMRPTARRRRCCATRQGGCGRSIGTTALTVFCERFKAIQQRHGRESVAFLSTGQIATEEMALLGSLAKFGMGMLHGDGNTRQCMATSVVAYKQSFGFDAPPYTYDDFEESDVIVLVGSNLCIAHPILWQRICRNPHQPQIIVVDPRQDRNGDGGDAAPAAAAEIGPDAVLRPGAHLLIREGWIDARFHRRAHERLRGVSRARGRVHARARRRSDRHRRGDARCAWPASIHEGKRVSFWWTMGVNQSYEGVRTAQSLINLALMTGNIGRPGTGANSITGQCNAMGSRLFSNTTNLLGGRDFQNAEHRAEGRRHSGHRRRPHSRPRQLGLRPDHRRHSAGKDPRAVGHRHEPGPFLDQPEHAPRRALAARLSGRAGHVLTRPRRPSWPTSCCRPPPGARRKARSSTPSGASA